MADPPEHALLIGVDFGTTYSAVGWSWSGDPDEIRLVKAWPGNPRDLEQVQTVLSYNTSNPVKYKWGFQAETSTDNSNAAVMKWFKLLLDTDAQTGVLVNAMKMLNVNNNDTRDVGDLDELQATIKAMNKVGKKPVELVTDFLRKIHARTMSTIGKTYPPTFIEQLGKRFPIKYCLTVPAVWSDRAKDLTRQAAKAAGMNEMNSEIRLISEPEAAAVHCLKKFQDTEHCLHVGDTWVIADCGGGTVDLISYEVTAVTPRLKVKECVEGTGGLCGSTALNRRFEAKVKSLLGASIFASMSSEAKTTTYTHFDQYMKPNFIPADYREYDDDDDDDDEEEKKHNCQVPGVPDGPRVKKGYLRLTEQEMKDIFLPTFQEITRLVQAQVKNAEQKTQRPISGILLVGGFGSSEYLRKYLSSNIKDKDGASIKILQPPDAWTAIVRGAVADSMALHHSGERNSMLDSRVARYSYGVRINDYPQESCPPRNRYWDEVEEVHRCRNHMLWFVKKGQDVPSGLPITFDLCYKDFDNSNLLRKHYHRVYCCEDANPAGHKDEPGARIHKLCVYKANFSNSTDTPDLLTPITSPQGRLFWKLNFAMIMSYNTHLIFSTELRGKNIGTANVDYDHKHPRS